VPAEPTLLVERRGAVQVLTLNRPTRLNAMSPDLVTQILDAARALRTDRSCRAVVITGAGRAFSAGADLAELDNRDTFEHAFERALALCWGLRRLPQPLIAAVEGPAVGSGLSLACMCDLRVASRTARFGAAFVRVGLSGGDGGSSYFLPKIVGPEHAADLLFTGRIVEAEEALRMGLVGTLTEEGQALPTALALAETVAERGEGPRHYKALLNSSQDRGTLEQILGLDAGTQLLLSGTGRETTD